MMSATACMEDLNVSADETSQRQGDQSHTEPNADDVLTVLRVRGVAVSDEARQRIQSEQDPERLQRWQERAVIANAIEDVIDDPN